MHSSRMRTDRALTVFPLRNPSEIWEPPMKNGRPPLTRYPPPPLTRHLPTNPVNKHLWKHYLRHTSYAVRKKHFSKQECIPVGCVLTGAWPYLFLFWERGSSFWSALWSEGGLPWCRPPSQMQTPRGQTSPQMQTPSPSEGRPPIRVATQCRSLITECLVFRIEIKIWRNE